MTIKLQSFIDGAGRQGAGANGYRRPEEITFDDGTNFSSYMPSSAGGKGMRGTVIPHAKPFGGSRAYDPHKPPHRRVHIDPHIEGQSVVVDLAQITQDIAEEATLLGQEYADSHSDEVPEAIDLIRLRGSAALHLIGASQRAAANDPAPVRAPPRQVIQAPPPPPPAQMSNGPRTIKAASFGGAPAQQAQPEAPMGGLLDAYQKPRAQHVEAPPMTTTVGPPTRKVTFGVPGFGLHEAYYHDVIIREQQFVLVYDERYKGGGRFLPQIDGPFAARVEGDPVDYKLVWPDQSFTDPTTGRAYFPLLIEERVSQGEK